MDRRAWRATVHGVTKSWIRLKRLNTHRGPLIWYSVIDCSVVYYGIKKKRIWYKIIASRNAKLPLLTERCYPHATGISNVMIKYITYKNGIFVSYKIELLVLSLSNLFLGFLCGSAGKESTCNAGDLSSIPWRRERLPTPVF